MPHVPKLVCATDGLELVIAGTGILIEMFRRDGEPYYKIYSDKWHCAACDFEVYLLADQPAISIREEKYLLYTAHVVGNFAF